MNRHIKLYPNHGPCEDPIQRIKEESDKKISSALATVPIIPLARTQLEELASFTLSKFNWFKDGDGRCACHKSGRLFDFF
jgi:hypothetical protein